MPTRVLKTSAEFEQLRSAWEALDPFAELPMQQFAWVNTCLKSFHANQPCVLFTVDGATQLKAVATFVYDDNRLRLIPPGQTAFEATLPIAQDMASWQALGKLVSEYRWPVMYRRVPKEWDLHAYVRDSLHTGGIRFCRSDANWAYLVLPKRSEDIFYPEGESALRKKCRRASLYGSLKLMAVRPTLEELPNLWKTALHIEESSWKGPNGTALSCDRVQGSFFENYARAAAANGMLHLFFLSLGDQLVAMQIAVLWKKRLWFFKAGYDAAFSRCSPGNLLTYEIAKYATSQNWDSIEFMGTCEDYKLKWSSGQRHCHVERWYPLAARGFRSLAGDVMTAARNTMSRIV
jgi:hypothetical protein